MPVSPYVFFISYRDMLIFFSRESKILCHKKAWGTGRLGIVLTAIELVKNIKLELLSFDSQFCIMSTDLYSKIK